MKRKRDLADFVVTPEDIVIPVSQGRMRAGFDQAGFPNRPATKTSEEGVIYTVPTERGLIDVRIMEGSMLHPRRVVFTTHGTNSPRTPGGDTPRGTKTERRTMSHLEQKP